MDWNKFNKTILEPFEEKGDDASEFIGDANVFTYTQIRLIAREGFKAGVASQQVNPADKGKPTYCGGCGYTHTVNSKCPIK